MQVKLNESNTTNCVEVIQTTSQVVTTPTWIERKHRVVTEVEAHESVAVQNNAFMCHWCLLENGEVRPYKSMSVEWNVRWGSDGDVLWIKVFMDGFTLQSAQLDLTTDLYVIFLNLPVEQQSVQQKVMILAYLLAYCELYPALEPLCHDLKRLETTEIRVWNVQWRKIVTIKAYLAMRIFNSLMLSKMSRHFGHNANYNCSKCQWHKKKPPNADCVS